VSEIKPAVLIGRWKGEKDTLEFLKGGAGMKTIPGNTNQPFTYEISGNAITVKQGESSESYFMQADLQEIYKVVSEGRFAGDRAWYARPK
jgi:hypothetical protein